MAAVAAVVVAVASCLADPHVDKGVVLVGSSCLVGVESGVAWGWLGTSLGMMLSRGRCSSLKVTVSFT